jgi:hypothetical protein
MGIVKKLCPFSGGYCGYFIVAAGLFDFNDANIPSTVSASILCNLADCVSLLSLDYFTNFEKTSHFHQLLISIYTHQKRFSFHHPNYPRKSPYSLK